MTLKRKYPCGFHNDKELKMWITVEVMGWEFFHIDYWAEDMSSRQKELEEWMNKVEIDMIGDYFIDVANDFWIEVERWNPLEIDADALLVLEKMIESDFVFYSNIRGKDDWWVAFIGDEIKGEYTADTFSQAICHAAYNIVEKSNE